MYFKNVCVYVCVVPTPVCGVAMLSSCHVEVWGQLLGSRAQAHPHPESLILWLFFSSSYFWVLRAVCMLCKLILHVWIFPGLPHPVPSLLSVVSLLNYVFCKTELFTVGEFCSTLYFMGRTLLKSQLKGHLQNAVIWICFSRNFIVFNFTLALWYILVVKFVSRFFFNFCM